MTCDYEAAVAQAEVILRKYGAVEYSDPKIGLDLYARAMAIVMQDQAEGLRKRALRDKLAHAISAAQGNKEAAPKRRGPTPGRYALRDRQIVMAVFRIKEAFEIPASRNEFSPPISACDVVAAAFLRLYQQGIVSRPVSYEYILELWKQRPGHGLK